MDSAATELTGRGADYATRPAKGEKVKHKEFAQRIAQAVDVHAHIPPPNFGRLQWFVDQMVAQFGTKRTPETYRKWLAGETLPRPRAMHQLAEILQVDEAWLSLGRAPELDRRQQKLRDAAADGVVNVVAGFIQMCGSNPAFPEPSDKRAQREHIDVYAIIKGVQYAFHVVLEKDGRFAIPVEAEETFVVGVVRTSDLTCEFVEVTADVMAQGKRKGGLIEVLNNDLPKISTFAERL